MTSADPRIAELETWMQGKEGENQEFKEAKSRFDFEELAKSCCALANEGGGRIILGVSDRRPRRVVGSAAFEQPERTRKGLCERLPLAIDFEEIQHPDGRVLVFHVPGRPIGMPVKYAGIYWSRKEDSLVPLAEERLREIFAESGRDFSAEVCPGLQFSDLDLAAVEDFRRRWIDKSRRADDSALADRLAAQSAEELLQDAEAAVEGGLTYAALILFGTPTAVGRHLAQAEVVFEYRSSEAAGPAQDRIDFRRGFFAFHDELWNRINLRNDKQDFQDGLFVHPIPTFTERAVREAILNAVSHRDYQLGGSTFVRQFARRLEIDSPGGLPYGITLDNILDRQNPRNRRIAEIFARCGLVERAGQGMNLIFEESIRNGKAVPDFPRTDKYQVGLTLYGNVQDPQFIRFVEEVSKKTRAVFTTRDWWLMSLVAIGERIPKDLRPRADRLLDLGLIERVRGRGFILSRRYYEFVGEKGKYTRRKGLDREQNLALLLNHIQANADTGCTLNELCDVLPALTDTQVRSLLRILRRRGRVHSIGVTRGSRWFLGSDSSATFVTD